MMDFLFKAFLENSPCPVWMMGIDFRLIYINKAYRDLYNLGNIDVDGKLLDELFPGDVGHIYKRQ
ncbi:MAG: PAS domain-containing protein [Turicibacter sp.]